MRQFSVAAVLLIGGPLGGCGNDNGASEIKIETSDLDAQFNTWVNSVGLGQTDPDVWRERLG